MPRFIVVFGSFADVLLLTIVVMVDNELYSSFSKNWRLSPRYFYADRRVFRSLRVDVVGHHLVLFRRQSLS